VRVQNRALYLGFPAAAAALIVFAWLANGVLREQTAGFDAAVRSAVHAWATPSLTFIMLGFTQLGSGPFLIGVGALVVWRLAAAGRKHAALLLAIAALGGEALDQILKLCFHRPRPDAFFGLADPATYSFPSGHALTATCFYGVLAAVLAARTPSVVAKAGLWALAVVLAGLIGFSRVYLGVHYPSDVLAGYAAGIVWIAAVRAAYGVWRWRGRRRAAPPA
jgi:undecaprenyl-diphosphatase